METLKIPALHQGKETQPHGSSAAALKMLGLGSVGKTQVKAESWQSCLLPETSTKGGLL